MPTQSKMPPITRAQRSRLPNTKRRQAGRRQTHVCTHTSKAQRSSGRCAVAQTRRSGWRNSSRSHGRSVFPSSRLRTVLRAISFERATLLPVAIHAHRTGTRAICETPSTRSSKVRAVMAADNAGESSRRRTLSIRIATGDRSSLAKSRLRHFVAVIIAGFRHDSNRAPCGDDAEHLGKQAGAGTRAGLIDQMQGRGPLDEPADDREEKQRKGMRPIRVTDEWKITQQFRLDQPSGLVEVRARRVHRNVRNRRCPAGRREFQTRGGTLERVTHSSRVKTGV